ncbi:MerR family transcriptional regulator [Nonomuraea maritima]|nr:MerR family transcriptional regulator [Nonomuraea maritima]
MTPSATWKVGRLAEAGGLTVRMLHHWDAIGLLSPSQRTTGGHREYTEDDLVRLYQVLALRSLGLALDTIAVCLDAGVDPTRLVRDHLAGVEASMAALEVLRERLVRLGEELSSDRAPASTTLLDALQAIGGTGPGSEHTLGRHLDADQRQVLRARASALGPAMHYLLEIEWPELYRRAERLRGAGTPATDQKSAGWWPVWTSSARCSPVAMPASRPVCGLPGTTIRPPCQGKPTPRPTTGESWPSTWTAPATAPPDLSPSSRSARAV